MGQVTLLKHAVLAPPEMFSFEQSEKRQPPLEGLAGSKSPLGTPNQAWLSLDLLETLSGLAQSGLVAEVCGAAAAPELILLRSMAHLQ